VQIFIFIGNQDFEKPYLTNETPPEVHLSRGRERVAYSDVSFKPFDSALDAPKPLNKFEKYHFFRNTLMR
jgi:hypothetical protein